MSTHEGATPSHERVVVVGAGAWGTTMASMLSRRGINVTLVTSTTSQSETLARTRENARYLPGVMLPEQLMITADAETAAASASVVLMIVPSQRMRSAVESLNGVLRPDSIVVSFAKGFELGSLLRMTEVIAAAGGIDTGRICALSGPNLAAEIAAGLPASTVVAGASSAAIARVQQTLSSSRFRVYTSEDVVGVEYGGALKNVVAIGAGVADGLSLGQNAKAAFIARGLAEISRLGVAAGANPLTFGGLSGLGDLIATCASPLSRNRTFGEQLGRGVTAESADEETPHVVEGLTTSRAAVELGQRYSVETPIAAVVVDVLDGRLEIRDAIERLMSRDTRPERDRAGSG